MLTRLVKDELAASAAEYGLVASLLAILVVSGIAMVGNVAGLMFNYIGSEVSNTLH